ncbi:MAG: protein kinase, partial [Gemmataceae bacterium]|nr:protein kinase [Gemmataceae bacterium]
MAIRVQNQAEPIPGYRLIERIGIGGFGEVWKAEAPGGILKAIKFVHGSLQADDGQGVHAQQELKALNRVKSVRHPYILSLERYDIVDGQLLIVMELADRNLWDRFKECRSQGLIGIPRDELLRYMEEAAEALDLMTNQYQLQHLDIKPQNLFLVHNHVKVADFGLVKDLEGMKAHVTSGVTPIYAAPETFDGIVSSQCDQYSLAIVYQELLTGQRPFSGTNIRQLLMQHMTGIPDVAPLPPGDREVILKALAKKPEDRHASCTAMVQALRRGASAAGATWLPPSTTAEVTLPTTPASGHSRNTLSNPLPLAQAPSQPAESLSGIIDRRSRSMAAIKSTPADLPEMTRVGLFTDRARQPAAPPRQEVTGPGVLFPALIVGVGKLGMQVLQQVRKFLHERCGPPSLLPNIRFLQVDTDPSIVTEARQTEPEAVLQEKEVFLARLNRPVHYLKPMRGRPRLDAWIDNQMIYRIPRNHQSTEGLRALGRLALIDNYPALVRRMQTELDFITNPSALTTADKKTQLGLRTNRPRIYIVTSLGGGTGSGMFLDLAYLFRHLLKQMGYVSPDVVALLLAPTNDSTPHGSLVLTNTYAALMELNHFSAPHVTFTGHYEENEWPINDKAPPFTRIQVLSLPAESKGQAPTRRVLALAGDFLCRELITPLGKKIDAARAEA